jgi:hypothetical protein
MKELEVAKNFPKFEEEENSNSKGKDDDLYVRVPTENGSIKYKIIRKTAQ